MIKQDSTPERITAVLRNRYLRSTHYHGGYLFKLENYKKPAIIRLDFFNENIFYHEVNISSYPLNISVKPVVDKTFVTISKICLIVIILTCLPSFAIFFNIIITVPAFMSLWSGHDVFLEHKRRYTLPELKQKLVSAGFQIEKISYFNFFKF